MHYTQLWENYYKSSNYRGLMLFSIQQSWVSKDKFFLCQRFNFNGESQTT